MPGRADERDSSSPGAGYFTVNHKLVQLFRLVHAQGLEPVAGLAGTHGQSIADFSKVKVSDKAIAFFLHLFPLYNIGCNLPPRKVCLSRYFQGEFDLQNREGR